MAVVHGSSAAKAKEEDDDDDDTEEEEEELRDCQNSRVPVIEGQKRFLEDETAGLREATVARNRALHEQLRAVEASVALWERRLAEEIANRDAASSELQNATIDALVADVWRTEETAVMALFEAYHGTAIPETEAHLEALKESATSFAKETVPRVTEASDAVSRKLQKASDTFEVQNARILKREHKIVETFKTHAKKTAQSFEDERATRRAKTFLFTEDLRDQERAADVDEERLTGKAHTDLRALRKYLDDHCANEREHHDNVLLDAMIFAQHKLQASVLKAFGSESQRSGKKSAS
mmetsp:Transcript_14778/g.44754  ORF Transcript_14778/g.44754 Transcript_14778/m.44754 type:complete len:296 (+) Transcript_14778:86-973(+)